MRSLGCATAAVHSCAHHLCSHFTHLPLFLSALPSPPSNPVLYALLSVLIFALSSQQVAHAGVAVAGDMECTGSSCSPPNPLSAKLSSRYVLRSLTREQQWRGAWSAPAAAALHPTHPQLSGSGGRGGGADEGRRGAGEGEASGRRGGQQGSSPASSKVEVASPSLQAFRPLGINAPPPPTPPRLLEPCLSFCFMYFFSIPSALKSHHSLGRNSQATDLPLAIPALRVCLAGGGEGCGVSTAIPSRLSPAAVQRGTHTGRLGGGLPGKESPAAAAAALSACVPCRWRGGAGVNTDASPRPSPVAVQVAVGMGGRQHCQSLHQGRASGSLGIQQEACTGGEWEGSKDDATALSKALPFPVNGPSPLSPPCLCPSHLSNLLMSGLPTDQLCVCALQVEGRGGGQHRRFPTLLPYGRAGWQQLEGGEEKEGKEDTAGGKRMDAECRCMACSNHAVTLLYIYFFNS
ncbi:unnamed protein product [Closterium sp. NIES-64]|nr:unnamed protein product [Closterium sp. NIES-64]